MSQWDKLIADILRKVPNLRFEDLRRALLKMGYTEHQTRGGSSHNTYRKSGCSQAHTIETGIHRVGSGSCQTVFGGGSA